ncbi:hypothetical protein NKH57_07665 [Mesorhizobium sp. M1050]|uniref:hypothetical protein n=2 Tax=Mesorhizobium TaxID=68287 RepID=UPI003338734C
MNLSAPTQIVFIISVVIAIIGVLAALGILAFIPLASVWIVLIAFIVLAGGCLMRGACQFHLTGARGAPGKTPGAFDSGHGSARFALAQMADASRDATPARAGPNRRRADPAECNGAEFCTAATL